MKPSESYILAGPNEAPLLARSGPDRRSISCAEITSALITKMHPLTKLRVTLAMSLAPMALSQAEDVSLALNLMNQARQSHGLQPLQWDTNLAAYAQYWATEMAIGLVPFSHAQGQLRPQQGENIYEQQSTQCNAAYDKPLQTAMQSWLAEAAGYAGQPVATGTEPWLHWGESCCF